MSPLDRARAALDRHPTRADIALVLLLFGLDVLTLWASRSFEGQGWETRSLLHTLVLILPLIWRRRYPSAVLVIMTAFLVGFELLDLPTSEWTLKAMLVALYSAGVYGDPRRTTPVRLATVLVFFGMVLNELFFSSTELPGNELLLQVLTLAANSVIVGATWWFGDSMRIRRLRELELTERTAQLEHEREENARRAVLDERVRIARELHDVVAHHVSVMGNQAGAARRTLTKNPAKAEEALSAIEATSRTAVHELHRLLGFLRQESEAVELSPQPSLSQLGDLISSMREAGLPVEVTIEGEQRPLTPGVDLSAYRIVQEALTNVLKHAGKAHAAVTVRYCPDAVDIEIVDDGRGNAGETRPAEGGKGLIGMRERVSLLGGSLSVGHHPGVGYSVRAHLPLREAPA
ncbi:MAG: sensor histidine kinase [Chloroflexota bacterium]|nr:sensor histidine kinase [Chloroflexota bacterium]